MACACMSETFRSLYSHALWVLGESSGGGYRIPRRRGRQLVGGAPTYKLAGFPKNCMKLRKFWSVGGGGAPLGSVTDHVSPKSEVMHEKSSV